jgi:hypothetical protein
VADFYELLRQFLQDCAGQTELPDLASRASELLRLMELERSGDPQP